MNQYIHIQNERIGSLRQRLISAVSLLLVSSLLLSSASFAWLTLSQAPETAGMTSNIGANGNLEIALGKNIGESAIGDSFDKKEVTLANRTWGNLVDLSDSSYGLQEIALRPAILNSSGGAVNTLHPLAYPLYREDGRAERLYANNMFTGTFNGGWFTTSAEEYGVRGIGTAAYIAPGVEGTFGPLSQRQEIYYQAYHALNTSMMRSSYESLCRESQSVLMAYCRYGTGVSAADFNLNDFSSRVNAVISAANEDLRVIFTAFAAAEMTPAEDYFLAMELLQEKYPEYEIIQPLLDTAIQAMGAVAVGDAIAELRDLQDTADRLKKVIASGEINGSDGYSMEEIVQTVGLVFDLERTSFTENGNEKSYYYYSSIRPDLVYHRYTEQSGSVWYWWDSYNSVLIELAIRLWGNGTYQDNDSRETIAYGIDNDQLDPISKSLRLADLDYAVADLYVSHWNYWDVHAEEYQRLLDEINALQPQVKQLEDSLAELREQADADQNVISALEAELEPKKAELSTKRSQRQTLLDEKIYAPDDSRLETLQSVMLDTIEAMRKYTLWSIAYYACDGRVPDDAYRRMQEIANSSEYIHPRTAYQALCNYGVTPEDALTKMVEAYEKLEEELLFLPEAFADTELITWPALREELRRILGTITIQFDFVKQNMTSGYNYSSQYSPEDTVAPTDVMTRIREEIEAYRAADISGYNKATYRISYSEYEESSLWSQALSLLGSFHYDDYFVPYSVGYENAEYTLVDLEFAKECNIWRLKNYWFDITIGVGSEDNFNESGLTVRQTRFQKAQESISYYQNQLITAAVNADKDMVTLLMQMIAGESSVSLVTISDYLDSLQQQLECAEGMMYQAALAMAASDYAKDTLYELAYSDSAPQNAAGLIELLRQRGFDEKVLEALDHRMELLENQKDLLKQSETLLKTYQNPTTGALTVEQIPTAEAVALLNPVLDLASLTLYGYVEEEQEQEEEAEETIPPSYLRTVLYRGFGSPAVQINGKKVTVGDREPITIFGDVYLTLGHSLSGGLLALAKTQVETYAPPSGSLSAEDIVITEMGMNRQAYAMGTGENMFTLNLYTADAPYTLPTNLWTYTGNTDYISANNVLFDIYGYCIDLALRTNAADSDLLLQTEAINRIYNDGEALTDTAMGAGSYMEFSIEHSSYTVDLAKEYMACLRVAITDTKTGYIYGYAALDMDAAEVAGITIKAPLRLYDKDTGVMLKGDTAQYLCHLEQNLEKNLTVYVYLDGAKTTSAMASAYDEQSLQGALNLQFCSSAALKPAVMEKLR